MSKYLKNYLRTLQISFILYKERSEHMQKIFSRILRIVILAVAILSSVNNLSICFAENFQFVDAENTTGYYVDIDSVKIESPEFVAAKIAVVKANLNKMYVYNVRINHKEQTYQIVSSQILEYDTRSILESNNRSRPFRPYAAKSEMSELINFILYGDDLSSN